MRNFYQEPSIRSRCMACSWSSALSSVASTLYGLLALLIYCEVEVHPADGTMNSVSEILLAEAYVSSSLGTAKLTQLTHGLCSTKIIILPIPNSARIKTFPRVAPK